MDWPSCLCIIIGRGGWLDTVQRTYVDGRDLHTHAAHATDLPGKLVLAAGLLEKGAFEILEARAEESNLGFRV